MSAVTVVLEVSASNSWVMYAEGKPLQSGHQSLWCFHCRVPLLQMGTKVPLLHCDEDAIDQPGPPPPEQQAT